MPALKIWIIRTLFACLPACALMSPFISHSFAAESAKPNTNKINKWVDDKGVTHYGDTLPPQYNNNNSVINSRGIVIKRNDSKSYKPELSPEEIEQARRDRALLASFTNVQEIDLALGRHLQMDEITIQGLQQRRTTAVKQLESNQKFAASFENRKKPVPADVTKDIQDNQAEIGRIDAQIQQQKDNVVTTRKKFEADKQRFTELKANAGK